MRGNLENIPGANNPRSQESKGAEIPGVETEAGEEEKFSKETKETISNTLAEFKTTAETQAIDEVLKNYKENQEIPQETKEKITQLKNEDKGDRTIFKEIDGWKFLEKGEEYKRRVEVLDAASKIIDIDKLSSNAKKLILGDLNIRAGDLKERLEKETDSSKKKDLENKINSLNEARKELMGNITEEDPKEIEEDIKNEVKNRRDKYQKEIDEEKRKITNTEKEIKKIEGLATRTAQEEEKLTDLKKNQEAFIHEKTLREEILKVTTDERVFEERFRKIAEELTEEDTDKAMDEIIKLKKEGEGARGEGKAEGEIRFKEEEMPWSEEALRRSNREFLKEYGLVPELNEDTLGHIDEYLKDSIFKEQLKMAKEWAERENNKEEIQKALGGREKFSDRELVAEVKRMGGFEEMMKGEGLPKTIEEAKDRWKQLNMLRETWKNGEAPAQAAGLTLYEFEKKKGLKKGEGLKGEVDTKKEEVQEHWKKLVEGKFAPEVRDKIQKEYKELLGELEEKEKELQTLQDTEKDILEATSGRDLEKEVRGKIMEDLMKAGNQLETDTGRRNFAGKMGWKIEELSLTEKMKRKVKGEPTDVVKVIYETGEMDEIAKSDLKETLIEAYKNERQRDKMTDLIKEAAPSKGEAVKNAYEALKGSLIQQAKEKLNEVASPEKLGKIKERVGEGEIDPVAVIEGLNKGILKKGFFGNLEKDYGMLNGVVGSAGLGELPDIDTISDEQKAKYENIVKSKDRLGLIGLIIDLLLGEVKEE